MPLGCGVLAGRDNVDVFPIARAREGHLAFDDCENRVVFAHHDADAGIELRSPLTDDDVARNDNLAAKALDTQALGIGIATVAGRAGALLGGE